MWCVQGRVARAFAVVIVATFTVCGVYFFSFQSSVCEGECFGLQFGHRSDEEGILGRPSVGLSNVSLAALDEPREDQPGQEQPAKEQPGKEQAGKERSGKEQPGKEQPGKERPGEEQPGKEQPGEEQPGEDQRGEEQPGKEQPGKQQSGEEQPGKEQPGKEQPGEEQPGDDQPGEEQPGKDQPGKEQPGKVQPGEEQHGKEQPGKEQPSKEQPGKEQPGREQPGKVQPGEEQPGKEQPGKEQPGKEQPGEDQPGQSQPGDDQRSEEHPVQVQHDEDLESAGLPPVEAAEAPEQRQRQWEAETPSDTLESRIAVASAVQELALRGECGKSVRGMKHRSLICTIVRNDIHLREFIVRNLLAGFCHIVIYDNNRIFAGMDHNITLLLQPFIEEGLVTHVPVDQNETSLLANRRKNGLTEECLHTYGATADWAITMDTDEYFLFADSGNNSSTTSIGTLDKFLAASESSPQLICAFRFNWMQMYGEHKVLKREGALLMEEFPRIMTPRRLWKVLYRPDLVVPSPPHGVQSMKKGCSKVHKNPTDVKDGFKLFYLHYNAKTIQEFIIKSEQSIPPFIRLLEIAYDPGACIGPNLCLAEVGYHAEYKALVKSIMGRLRIHQGGLPDGGVMLAPPSEVSQKTRADYALYLFMKLRVSMNEEWDEEFYLQSHQWVARAVKRKSFIRGIRPKKLRLVDGLHHFIVRGFQKSLRSCWNRNNGTSVCVG